MDHYNRGYGYPRQNRLSKRINSHAQSGDQTERINCCPEEYGLSDSQNRRRMAVARSAFMGAEEIDRERAGSGWNPYEGEEEGGICGEMMSPYFQMPDYTQVLEEQKATERDFRKLQSMYPEAAKALLPYIEEECDKMEYEGSPMFDEMVDQTTVYRIRDRIRNQVQDQFPEAPGQEMPEEMFSMQYQGNRRNNWLDDLIRVMLLQEMHHRRCRHRDCRRNRW